MLLAVLLLFQTNYKKLSKEAADEAKKNSPEANNKNVKKPEKELKEKDLDINTKKEIAELSGKKRSACIYSR